MYIIYTVYVYLHIFMHTCNVHTITCTCKKYQGQIYACRLMLHVLCMYKGSKVTMLSRDRYVILSQL